MRRHTKYAFSKLSDKTIHYRQYSNQRCHAECYACHGGKRDKRYELIAAFGADVTQANKQFQGFKHADKYRELLFS